MLSQRAIAVCDVRKDGDNKDQLTKMCKISDTCQFVLGDSDEAVRVYDT